MRNGAPRSPTGFWAPPATGPATDPYPTVDPARRLLMMPVAYRQRFSEEVIAPGAHVVPGPPLACKSGRRSPLCLALPIRRPALRAFAGHGGGKPEPGCARLLVDERDRQASRRAEGCRSKARDPKTGGARQGSSAARTRHQRGIGLCISAGSKPQTAGHAGPDRGRSGSR